MNMVANHLGIDMAAAEDFILDAEMVTGFEKNLRYLNIN